MNVGNDIRMAEIQFIGITHFPHHRPYHRTHRTVKDKDSLLNDLV
jgi:hypothetical protein